MVHLHLRSLIVTMFAIAVLLFNGCKSTEPEAVSEPLSYDFGTGPTTLVSVDLLQPTDDMMGSTIRVAFSHGTAVEVYKSPEFQLRIFLDSPEHDVILFHSADRTIIVTPDFELLQDFVPSRVDAERDEILFDVPFYNPEMSALASLGWDQGVFYRHRTALVDLDYYGLEIGRAWVQSKTSRPQQKNEIYFVNSTPDQIRKANNKGWPAGTGDTIPDDGTNPPNNPGKLYKGWPLTFDGTRYWEYSGSSGFIKRVHIDTNGNGKIDAGEPHGYIGRCPYVVGINDQAMYKDSSIWTSRWQDHGQRIVHRFKKFKQADGSEKWQVESTHETQQPDGSWKKTTGTKPIVHDPYTNPGDVPGNSAFGL